MIHFLSSVFEASSDIIGFQIGKIPKDIALRNPRRQEIQHILDADTHPANARATAALQGAVIPKG